jgi:hypothetical protein
MKNFGYDQSFCFALRPSVELRPTCRSRTLDLGLIYDRTCRVRNGYSTGHVDVCYMCYLMEVFMLKRDGLAPGICAQRGRLVIVPDDSFAVVATMAPAWRAHIWYHVQFTASARGVCCVLQARPCQFLLSKYSINKYLVTEEGCDPSCRPAAGPL